MNLSSAMLAKKRRTSARCGELFPCCRWYHFLAKNGVYLIIWFSSWKLCVRTLTAMQIHSGSDYFVEPYDRVNCAVGHIPANTMREFVSWDLEREHGDLGLGSANDRKPPLSMLGISLHQDRAGGAAAHLVQHIVDRAYGNVGMAKLRLDLVHGSRTLEPIEAVHDRLPNNLLDTFEAGINSIEQQPDAWLRDLGLLEQPAPRNE